MAKSTRKTSKLSSKVKKKKWYQIHTPTFMGDKIIGESYLAEPETAVGRTVQVNLMNVTGEIKSQTSNVKFEISGYGENRFSTKLTGYYFSPSTIKRMVRRKMTRIDDSLVLMTKDNQKIRIKPFVLTRGKVSRAVEYTLRAKVKEEMIGIVSATDYDNLFEMVIRYQIQREIKDRLSKIQPIRSVEIRILKKETREDAALSTLSKTVVVKKKSAKEESEEGEEQEEAEAPKEEKKPSKKKEAAAEESVSEEAKE